MITPAVTFTAFAIAQLVSGSTDFQVETAFTSLALISILTNPVAELVTAATNLASALSCLDRIQEYLHTVGRQDGRNIVTSKNNPGETEAGNAFELKQGLSLQTNSIASSNSKVLARISKGSFGWDLNKLVLNDINLELLRSLLTIVIGPVGSGKSTLLQSLLGETCILSGSVECASPKQIAYCAQQPWILNLSIKQNIVGVSDYDETRYQKVVETCQLHEDFLQLPEGDDTRTGNKGISLSGGQRQRIVSCPRIE